MGLSTFDLAAFEGASRPARKAMAQSLDHICRETGFLVLTGHGVPQVTIDRVWGVVNRFFAQDVQGKAKVAPAFDGAPYGWIGPLKEALAASKGVKTPPDLKESFNAGPQRVPEGASQDALDFCYQPTPYPDLAGFQSAWDDYYGAMEKLAARIMVAFAAALHLPDDHFAPPHCQPDFRASGLALSSNGGRRRGGSTARRRAHGLRVIDDFTAPSGVIGAAGGAGWGLDRCGRPQGRLCHQHRRFDGEVDQ